MSEATPTTIRLQRCLDRLQGGDETARAELLNAACHRLTQPTRKMFRADGRLRRWKHTRGHSSMNGRYCWMSLLFP
jgi:hypothetical protein